MSWKDITPWIAKLAPMLGTALGGPMGASAGILIGQALGQEKPTPETVQKALEAQSLTGDQVAALQKAEMDFKLQMEQINVKSIQDLEALAVDDRKDARAMQVAVRSKTPDIGFYVITVGFFGLLTCMLFHVLPPENDKVLSVMVGSLGAAWLGAVNFFYGSTRDSQDKTKMIYNSTPTKEE